MVIKIIRRRFTQTVIYFSAAVAVASAFSCRLSFSSHHQLKHLHFSGWNRISIKSNSIQRLSEVVVPRLDSKMCASDGEIKFNEQDPPPYTLKERNPYDVHVYYEGSSEREDAMKLREKMIEKFQWMRFYSPKERPIGPHPIPMWEADFGHYGNRHFWSEVRDFIEKEHGNLSVLIHPHSLDGDYADHTKNAFWAGKALDLRIGSWKR